MRRIPKRWPGSAGRPPTLALLSHPIAAVHDYGEGGPACPPYLVMELVDGPSLAAVLAKGPLDAFRAMDVIAQVAAGLHAVHLAGLVHGDVKPANLLLDRQGHVKITDFGIARTAAAAVAGTGLIAVTPAYLAPERLADAPATPASDLYALGIVAYECLTGRPPFTGTAVQVAAAHRERPVPPLPDTVPAQVAGLVAELTVKDPAERPVSAGDVASRAVELRDALPPGAVVPLPRGAGQPRPTLVETLLPADPAGRRPLARRLGRCRPGAALAALAVAALVVAGLLGVLAGGALTRVTAAPAPVPSSTPARLVAVNGGSLTGQPVNTVRRHLLGLGLQVLAPGQIAGWDSNIRIWAKTWSRLIGECDARLRYFKDALEYDATQRTRS